MQPLPKALCGRAHRVSGDHTHTHTHPFIPLIPPLPPLSHTQEELPQQVVWKYANEGEEIATSATLPCHLFDTVAKTVVYIVGLDPKDTKHMLTADNNQMAKVHLRRCTEEELTDDIKFPDVVHSSTSSERSPSWQPCRFKTTYNICYANHL